MSAAVSPQPSAVGGPAVAEGAVAEFIPRVFGESDYDRVSSMLMAVVIGAAIVVGWMYLIYKTNEALSARVTAPLIIVDVFSGGGGSPDGTAGSTEKVDIPGAEAGAQASNNEEVPGDFEEPSVMANQPAMLDAVAEAGSNLAEADMGSSMPTGGVVATGRKSSKIGTGGPGLGFGPGDGGVAVEQRWVIVYNPGQTQDEYARQLDSFGVELAVVSGPNQLTYVSRFSDAVPTKRYRSPQGDNRLFFSWNSRARKGSDVALLKKAGIDVGESIIMQFYPAGIEQKLQQLEIKFKGRSPAEIRVTRFSVVPRGNGYDLAVQSQETLR